MTERLPEGHPTLAGLYLEQRIAEDAARGKLLSDQAYGEETLAYLKDLAASGDDALAAQARGEILQYALNGMEAEAAVMEAIRVLRENHP